MRMTMMAACGAAALLSGSAAAESAWKPLADVRMRSESVDQDGTARQADALTLRARLGVQSPVWDGFSFLVEAEGVGAVIDDYNSTVNGKTAFPIVNDPEAAEINRAQIVYEGVEGWTVTLGRQRLALANQRFVGNAGFRQNEQTFDAARVEAAFGAVKVSYAYVDAVQRALGNVSPLGQYESDSHILSAEIAGGAAGVFAPYVLLFDLDEVPVQSTATAGLRWTRSFEFGGGKLALAADLAHQSEYAQNPRDINLWYAALEAELKIDAWTLLAGWERLEGDGVTGFSTPLASLFKFNGWSDAFAATPAAGLDDLYAGVSYAVAAPWEGGKITTSAVYHSYADDGRGRGYGDEWNLLLVAAIDKKWTVEARAAFFDAEPGAAAGRDKLWVSLSYAL